MTTACQHKIVKTIAVMSHYHAVWRVIFCGVLSQRIIFVILKFVTLTSPEAWHCISDDVVNTLSIPLAIFFINTKLYLQRLAMDKQLEIEKY